MTHFAYLIAVPRAINSVLPGLTRSACLPFQILDLLADPSRYSASWSCSFAACSEPSSLIGPSIVLLFFGSTYDVVLSPHS